LLGEHKKWYTHRQKDILFEMVYGGKCATSSWGYEINMFSDILGVRFGKKILDTTRVQYTLRCYILVASDKIDLLKHVLNNTNIV